MNRILNTLLLGPAVVLTALAAVADYVREDELSVAIDRSVVSNAAEPSDYEAIDLRAIIPVASLEDAALKGLMYSANSWERNAAADASRTAEITARAGTLANGVFMSDGSAEVTVMAGRTGVGTVDWNATEISKNVYQLTHTVRKGGAVDAAGTCVGYFDFTHCVVSHASQAEVEAAVLGAITHKIAVAQDENWPWQPIDVMVVRSGIVTDEELEAGTETATTFDFKGRGVLHYEYELSGGTLVVIADDKVVATFAEPKADFVPSHVSFDGYGAHEVSFVYAAAGGGKVATIRNVRWEMPDESSRATGKGEQIRVDLQEGEVRTPKKFEHILPFVYSPTNFTGTVDGKSSRVSVVLLGCEAGDDPADVTTWTEISSTAYILKEATDEGDVMWRAKRGVWKATFEIYNGPTLKDTQIKFFDLRKTSNGLVIMLR